jgi:hypothetical protein
MPSILIVEKLGNIKSTTVKKWDESELYKKAGLKTADGFKCFTTWPVELANKTYNISLYGKTSGRATHENKYEFPPPVDNTLFFGNCILINKNTDGDVVDLSSGEWEAIYEHLYGGFEDLGDDDDSDEEESDDETGLKRTKDGYVKDGFVVGDDDDGGDDDDEEEGESDEDEEPIYTKKSKSAKKEQGSSKIKSVFELKPVEPDNYLDYTSELSEESYIE